MRPPLLAGASSFADTMPGVLRPATAIVLVVLLVLIAAAGIFQLVTIMTSTG